MGASLMQYDASGIPIPRQALARAGAFCMPGSTSKHGLLVVSVRLQPQARRAISCRAARTAHRAGLRQPIYPRSTDAGWASGQGVAPLNQLPTQTTDQTCR